MVYQGKKKLRNQYEDICKYKFADGAIHLMYLIANQSRADGKMLLRKAGYTVIPKSPSALPTYISRENAGDLPKIFCLTGFVMAN